MGVFVYEKIPKRIKAFSKNIKRIYNEGKLTWRMPESGSFEEYGEKVDYIKGTGTQYIITDYLPNTNTDITIDFTPRSYASMVFGQRYALAGQKDALVYYTDTATRFYSGFDSPNTVSSYNGMVLSLDVPHILHMNKDILEIDGNVQNSSFYGDYSTIDPDTLLPLAIFSLNQKDEIVDPRIFKGDIRSFIIRENDTIVMNLIPIRLTKQSWGDNPLNSFVLWDTVSNTVPKHIGTFLGPTTSAYVKTAYTTFTGTQYIDTMVNNDSTLTTRGKAKALVGAGECFVYGSREQYLVDTNAIFVNTSTKSVFCGMGANWKDRGAGSLDSSTSWFTYTVDKDRSTINYINYANTTPVSFNESDLTIHLGALNQRIGIDPRYFEGDVAYFNIEKEGVLLLDFIPCIETATGKAGFWDNVSDTFFSSSTNVDLIPGPIVSDEWQTPSTATIESNGDFVLEYTDELIPDWQYDNITGDVTLVYNDGEEEPPIYRDDNGDIIIEEEI